jgi:transcriptional regulator with XRE-family HTH domain
MIAPGIVNEIRRLLAEEKLGYRKIAALTGVSRGTVAAIASGKRPDYDALVLDLDDGLDEPAGPPSRCPGCGGLVYMPCVLCNVRNRVTAKPNQTLRGLNSEPFVPLDLNLRPEHRARYEDVLAARMNNQLLASPLPLGEGQGVRAEWRS